MTDYDSKKDYERFEVFIDGMEDVDFNAWYNEASYEQRRFADNIRHEVDEEGNEIQ